MTDMEKKKKIHSLIPALKAQQTNAEGRKKRKTEKNFCIQTKVKLATDFFLITFSYDTFPVISLLTAAPDH